MHARFAKVVLCVVMGLVSWAAPLYAAETARLTVYLDRPGPRISPLLYGIFFEEIKRVVPQYDPGQGYELAGFVWFQGFNDLVSTWTYDKCNQPGGYDMYGQLLAQFIRDVRKDLSAPKMPFVIGVMGLNGAKPPQNELYFRQAQAAPASLPEFKGNVVAVETAPFWDNDLNVLRERLQALWAKMDARAAEAVKKNPKMTGEEVEEVKMQVVGENFTPEEQKRLRGVSNFGFHYLGAAKIMAPIGKAFAEAMADVHERKRTPMDARTVLEKGHASGALPEGIVVRIGACLGAAHAKAPGDRVSEELKEMWEFTSNQVHRVVIESKEGKLSYHRIESRPFDSKGICKDLLEGKAIEIHARKGEGPEVAFVGTSYHLGLRSIEVVWNGETILDLHETNGAGLDV
jgi:hypothetical protein